MLEPLDEQYIKWLYHQVASLRYKNPARTYWSLTRHLYRKEFVFLIPNDDNRAEDGRDLRYEFAGELGIDPERDWIDLPCSFLEMILALSRRLAFETVGESRGWFWELLENLDLRHYNDVTYNEHNVDQVQLVDDILDTVIWRTYEPTGMGGLFPLSETEEDQRSVELWYQQAHYLLERD